MPEKWLQPRPEFGLDCLICADLAHQQIVWGGVEVDEAEEGRAPRVAPGVGGGEGDGGEREAFERGERERQRERERGRGGEDTTVVRGDERLAFGSTY